MKKTVLLLMVFVAAFAVAEGQREEPTSLDYWFFPINKGVEGFEAVSAEFGDFERFIADKYEAKAGTKVNTKLLPWDGGPDEITTAIAAGSPPDIVFDYIGRTGNWYVQGAAVAASKVVPQSVIDDILPAFKEMYTIDGELHAIPAYTWNNGNVVNVSLLERSGYTGEIPEEGEPITFEAFKSFLMAIKEQTDLIPYTIGCGAPQGDYSWWGFFWGYGAKPFNADGSTNLDAKEAIVKGYEYLLDLRDSGLIAGGVASRPPSENNQLFVSQKVAIVPGSKWADNQLPEDNCIFLPMPSTDGSIYNAMGPTGFIAFSEKKAIGDFIEYNLQPKYWGPATKNAGMFATTKTIADLNVWEGDRFQETVTRLIAEGKGGDFGLTKPFYNQFRTELSICGQKIFSGQMEPGKAVDEFLQKVMKLNGGK